MAQTAQHLQNGPGDTAWLSRLVETFETISRSHAPCAPIGSGEIDPAGMAALMSQLRRATPVAGYAMAG